MRLWQVQRTEPERESLKVTDVQISLLESRMVSESCIPHRRQTGWRWLSARRFAQWVLAGHP